MKKLLLIILLISCVTTAKATEDTLVVNKPSKVVIKDVNGSQQIQIFGAEGNEKYYYTNSFKSSSGCRSDKSSASGSVAIGFRKNNFRPAVSFSAVTSAYFGVLSPIVKDYDQIPVKTWGSWELGVELMEVRFRPFKNYRQHSFALGIGISQKFFKSKKEKIMTNVGGDFVLEDFPVGTRNQKCRLDASAITISASYFFNHSKSHNGGFGIYYIGSYNYGMRSVAKYKEHGHKVKIRKRGFKLNNYTSEFKLVYVPHHSSLGIFVKYSPESILDGKFGPKLSSFSVGIVL